MTIPEDIKQIFFETLLGDKTILEFEKWLYEDERLQQIINEEDYLDLISFNYKSAKAKYGLNTLFEKFINKAEFEKRRILKLLYKALNKEKDLPQILMTFYDLYCRNYGFFDNLGLGFGLAVEVPNSQANSWNELSIEQQQDLLNSFYPTLEIEIKKVITWIEEGKIILTGIKDENNHFVYKYYRIENEKLPTAYEIVSPKK